jgi:hypothetical protein
VKLLEQTFGKIFSITPKEDTYKGKIYREWDAQRARALGPSDLAEIDAIFSRQV